LVRVLASHHTELHPVQRLVSHAKRLALFFVPLLSLVEIRNSGVKFLLLLLIKEAQKLLNEILHLFLSNLMPV
jgi:hypothetical protein